VTAALLLKLETNRSKADAQTLEEWHRETDADHLHVLAANAVRAVNAYPQRARQIWANVWELTSDPRMDVEDYRAWGEEVRSIFDTFLGNVAGASLLVADAQRLGRSVEGAEALPGVREQLQQMRQKAISAWPWFDEEEMRQAKAECERGESPEARGDPP
jgi:hypothetical protein